jgi:uncharacterized protein YbjT (DUF2867 family)
MGMSETVKVAVPGGTGVLGRFVVAALAARGHEAVVFSRRTGVDLLTAQGLDEAMRGVQVVIDVSNQLAQRRAKAVGLFERATGNLVAAAQREGVRHLVAVSIVGIDRANIGYYHGKLAQERVTLDGRVPASVLRATQFHEFPVQILQRGGPFAVAPKWLTQPVAAREVADALVELALGEPVGRAPDIAGPEQHMMSDLVRKVLRATRQRRILVPLRLPGKTGKALAGGALVPQTDGPRGKQTFDAWLAEYVAAA